MGGATATGLIGLQRPGVTVTGVLPDPSWASRWNGIVVADELKHRLLTFGAFCLTQRESLSTVGLPVHGLALLSGPPGTGKTTLAHGLAHQVAATLAERGFAEHTLFATVDPHAFPSEFLGESQRAVGRLFSDTLPELADHGHPLVVLVDEVETLAMARARASLETNPVDVHRATDAVLTGLDALANRYPNVLLVATTNDERTVDAAFLSRVDVHARFGLPPADVIARILVDSLAEVGVSAKPEDEEVRALAQRCAAESVDPRRVRKLVLEALVSNGLELALAPRQLRVSHLAALLES
jgi:AAA+ superfamily predicted ATPase